MKYICNWQREIDLHVLTKSSINNTQKHKFISLRVSYYSKDKRPWAFSNLTWYPKQRFIDSLIYVTTQNHTFIFLRVSDCYEDERTTLVCSRYSKHRFIQGLSFAMVGHWYVTLFTLQQQQNIKSILWGFQIIIRMNGLGYLVVQIDMRNTGLYIVWVLLG